MKNFGGNMLRLESVIKWLILFLLMELIVFAIYGVMTHFLEVKNFEEKTPQSFVDLPIEQIDKPQEKLVVKPDVQSSLEPVVSVEEVQEKPKSKLEMALVYLEPDVQSDIVEINTTLVQPILYTKSIQFSNLENEKKKKVFIDMILPSILIAKYRITQERAKVKKLLDDANLSHEKQLWLTKKRYIFKAKSNQELYDKMEMHPTSIILAQAIIESGWGTSRFFQEANNLFGIWSFSEHEARIEATERRGDKAVYLKKYQSMEQSIYDHLMMLSTQNIYQEFREARLKTQDPFELIPALEAYSELGEAYIENLKNTIEKNELLRYDAYDLRL